MSSLPFESWVHVGKELYTHYFSPDESVAHQIAHWHLQKGATVVEILNKETDERKNFKRDGDVFLSLETGEEIFESPGIRELTIQIASLEKALRKERAAHAKTKAEKEDEMEKSEEYEDVLILFEFWKRVCKHPNSKMDLTRYRDVLPFLRGDGIELCARAIAGAATEHFSATRKNGTTARFDDWSLVFRNRSKFESFANRAKTSWKEDFNWDGNN